MLDEIGYLRLGMQARLLRVVQEHEMTAGWGEPRARRVDVGVLAASHRDLSAEVAAGRFRQDLYYRLRVVELRISRSGSYRGHHS